MPHYLHISLFAALFLAPLSAKAWVADDIQSLIQGNEMLENNSSAQFFTLGEGQYIVFAHGVAGYQGDFEQARQRAKSDAHAQISKLLGETSVSAQSLHLLERKGTTSTEQSLTIDQIDSNIFITSTTNRGAWIDGDFFHLITCIYINTPQPSVPGLLAEEFEDIELDASWCQVLEQHKELWLGGVGLVSKADDGQEYLITMVSAKESPAAHQTIILLQNYANREMAEYINGVAVKMSSILQQGRIKTTIGDAAETQIFSRINTLKTQSSKGRIKAPLLIGSLKHKNSKRKFALFAKALKDL